MAIPLKKTKAKQPDALWQKIGKKGNSQEAEKKLKTHTTHSNYKFC